MPSTGPKYDTYNIESSTTRTSFNDVSGISTDFRSASEAPKTPIFHSTPMNTDVPPLHKKMTGMTSINSRSSGSDNSTGRFVLKPNYVESSSHERSFRTPATVQTSASKRLTKSSMGSVRSVGGDVLPSTVVVVAEGRGHVREVGLAAIDLRQPLLTMAQFTDTHTYTRILTKLSILNPLEVVFSSTSENGRLINVIQDCMDGVAISTIHRKYFNDTCGLAALKTVAMPSCEFTVKQTTNRYYCLSGVAALLKYIEHIQRVNYAPKSLHVVFTSSELTFSIDHWSSRQLELVRFMGGGWEKSLYGAIRYTNTVSGARMLRASLLQPFADRRVIETRLDALEYLLENKEMLFSLKALLVRFPDVDWILSSSAQKHKEDSDLRCEQRLNYIIALKNTLQLLHPLRLCLGDVKNSFLLSIKNSVDGQEIHELQECLNEVIHEEAQIVKGSTAMETQRCYAIKSQVNGLIDVTRKVYSEIVDDITGQVEGLAQTYNIDARVSHTSSRGFHIYIPLPKHMPKPILDRCFIQVHYARGGIMCTTEEIYQLDQRSRETMKDILKMSNIITLELLESIRGKLSVLYGVAEAIATLDMVVGLAAAASFNFWVRPHFSSHTSIIGGRHATLDVYVPTKPVSNDISLSEEKRMIMLTGPNMSGKSMYLKQITLIQILAQIGSFVPAESATLRVVDSIYTVLVTDDTAENNVSTFQSQMNELSGALQTATSRSLIILDEPGECTNIDDGTSLVWAMLEKFLHTRCFLVVATHLICLTHLASVYPQITNYHMESTISDNGKLQVNYKCLPGVTEAVHYGMALAALTPLPQKVLKGAQEIAAKMTPRQKVYEPHQNATTKIDDSVYMLAHQLLQFATEFSTDSPNADKTCDSFISREEVLKERLGTLLIDFLSKKKH